MKTKLFWIIAILAIFSTGAQSQLNSPNWSSDFILPGVSGLIPDVNNGKNTGYINDILETDDGIYITGSFVTVEGVQANNIARWDGQNWHALGQGIINSGIGEGAGYELLKKGDSLYVVGSFTTAGGFITVNNIALWNTVNQTWSALNDGLSGAAFSIVNTDSSIIVGGEFENADNKEIPYFAKWNGSEWSEVSPNSNFNGTIHTIKATNDSTLFVGGEFTEINGESYPRVAMYTKESWNNFDDGADGTVYSIQNLGDDSLLVGGLFNKLGTADVQNLGLWDGNEWIGFEDSPDSTVLEIEGAFDNFLIGGNFSNIGTAPFNGIANLRKGEWEDIDSFDLYFNYDGVYAIEELSAGWLVGGNFDVVSNISVGNLALLDKSELTWDSFGSDIEFHGVNGEVKTIALDGTDVYIGGTFTTVGKKPISHMAKWNGEEWESMGVFNKNASIYSILVHGDSIYVGGTFSSLNKGEASNIAVYDKNKAQWSIISPGVNSYVADLEMYNDTLIVAGGFTAAHNITSDRIAKWHPETNTWSGFTEASGTINNAIFDVEISNQPSGSFFVGGAFNYGFTRRGYSPNGWINFGNISGTVHKVLSTESLAYFGGAFDSVYAVTNEQIYGVGSYNTGTFTFEEVGGGLIGPVYDLILRGDTLIAGGNFLSAGHPTLAPIPRLAFSDGTFWGLLGGGVNRTVRALASDDNHVYVGGAFSYAGDIINGKVSNGFAIWSADPGQVVSIDEEIVDIREFTLDQNYPNPFNPNTTITFSIANAGKVSLTVYNILGQKVATLINDKLSSGSHSINFDAGNLSSGVYMYRLQTDHGFTTRRMLLIK